jgi:hypothetical protein
MKRQEQKPYPVVLWKPEQPSATQDAELRDVSPWLAFLAYLAYLRSMRSPVTSDVRVMRLLIATVAVVLVAVALIAAGRSELVAKVLGNWPILP